jgi:hypothetical protein
VEVTNRCRHCDKLGERTEHYHLGALHYLNPYISGDATNWRIYIVHQQIAKKCNLLARNTESDCRYKPVPVMESSSMILCWDRSVVTDKTID